MSLWDLANADCITVMGSNMAENHPVAFRFVVEAQARGATVIHVDPRFTRTSALANIHAPIRSGSDIAFLGGIIRYILENDLWFRDFVLAFTNIATIVEDSFVDAEDNEGIFSGFDANNGSYKHDSWQYKGEVMPSALAEHYTQTAESFEGGVQKLSEHAPPSDPTLQHPNCVYQIMRRHYARYTPEMVERITGCPQSTFLSVCDLLNSETPAANAPAHSATLSAGPITRSACRSSAPPPSSKDCWAILVGPVAAFLPCVVIAAFRAARTFRRCTTCCQLICRSPMP